MARRGSSFFLFTRLAALLPLLILHCGRCIRRRVATRAGWPADWLREEPAVEPAGFFGCAGEELLARGRIVRYPAAREEGSPAEPRQGVARPRRGFSRRGRAGSPDPRHILEAPFQPSVRRTREDRCG